MKMKKLKLSTFLYAKDELLSYDTDLSYQSASITHTHLHLAKDMNLLALLSIFRVMGH